MVTRERGALYVSQSLGLKKQNKTEQNWSSSLSVISVSVTLDMPFPMSWFWGYSPTFCVGTEDSKCRASTHTLSHLLRTPSYVTSLDWRKPKPSSDSAALLGSSKSCGDTLWKERQREGRLSFMLPPVTIDWKMKAIWSLCVMHPWAFG